jgi:hypothetical protein
VPSVRRLPSSSFCLEQCHRCALVVGHPGHELKVFGWISEYKPRVYVITDGSGRSGISRISSTAALLSRLGASPGETFGALSDAEIYQAILEQYTSRFLAIVDELACSFVRHDIDCVAGDGAEGFNPTHDLCRVLINAAIVRAQRASGKNIANFEFSLTEWEQDCPESPHDERCLHWTLDDRLLSEKMAVAQQYVELKNEVRRAIAQRGEEYFRNECIRALLDPAPWFDTSKKPFYETWGERQVLNGQYQSVIRLEQHIMPLANAILDYALQANNNSLVVTRPD